MTTVRILKARSFSWQRLWLLAIGVLALSVASAEPVAKQEREIEYLLASVAASNVEFIRNGKVHSPDEAEEHMRRKYEYYSKRIETAEDFIARAGTKSMMSGKPYMVRLADREMRASEWLHSMLVDYRQSVSERESP